MSRIVNLALLPIKYVWVVGIILGVGLVSGQLIPGASAQVALDCQAEEAEGPCNDQPDACWNLDGYQAQVPAGYHLDISQRNACVEDPPEETSEGHVLAESTEVDSTGK